MLSWSWNRKSRVGHEILPGRSKVSFSQPVCSSQSKCFSCAPLLAQLSQVKGSFFRAGILILCPSAVLLDPFCAVPSLGITSEPISWLLCLESGIFLCPFVVARGSNAYYYYFFSLFLL